MNKQIFAVITAVLLSFSAFAQEKSGIQFTEGQWMQAVKKARAENKLIFMDAYTSWCGPCKMLKSQVFPNKTLGDFYNKNFVNVAFDMEVGEGPQLANIYRVQAYPTMFFIDPNTGKVVKQTLGYQEVDDLLKVAKSAVESMPMAAAKKKGK